jgi:hypothetical protein
MVDAAIERIEREQGAAQLERARPEAASALAKAADVTPMPARLRWKGLDVSDEFRQYAERVARGEDLPPFEGRVLAEPNPAFPWGAPPTEQEVAPRTGSGAKVAVWSSVLLALGLLGWSLVPRVEAGSGAPQNAIGADRLTTASADTDDTNAEAPAAPDERAPEVTSAALLPAPADTQPANATAPSLAPSLAPSVEPSLAPSEPLAEPSAVHSSVAPPAADDAAQDPVVTAPPAAAPVAPAATVAAKAPPRAASPAPAASAPPAAPAAPIKAVPHDEFGIMEMDEPGTSAPAPSGAPPARSAADQPRAGQASPGAVRKEPGSESSAKGSLLVETPSF